MKRPRALVWDWNGTLLDDQGAAVEALNRLLVSRGAAPTTPARYRERFRFPVRDYYAELGIDLAHEDWGRICTDFHRFYGQSRARVVRADAREALERARELGFRQYVLSAHREDMLRDYVAREGLAGFFAGVYGTDNLSGASKLARARAVFAEEEADLVFVGDTLHDAEVAQALGAACVLLTCGHQTANRLAASGCALAESLVTAVRMAHGMREGERILKDS